MKTTYLRNSALAATLLLSSNLMAQESTNVSSWAIKPFSPAGSYRTWSIGLNGGMLTPAAFYGHDDFDAQHDIGYGGYIKKQIWPAFGLRGDFLRGELNGEKSANGFYSKSETKLNYSAALVGELTLANINWRHRKSVVMPYVSGGAGVMGFKARLTPTSTGQQIPALGDNKHELVIPVGAGLKFALSKGIALDFGYTLNLTDIDHLDGYNYGDQNDKFTYAHAGLEFSLGSKSKPTLSAHNPVADLEADYTMKYDDLKNQFNSQLAAERQNTANQLSAMQSTLDAALKDSDGDGVVDRLDKCSNTPMGTKVDGSGCPLPANRPSETNVYITEADKKVVKDAIDNLEFDNGKSTIRSKSFSRLDRVAELLVSKNFSIKLAGHTDDVGSDASNLKLSKDRAESLKAYLVDKGVNASRIEATGYGESQPIATNKTAAGRQQNRRVEFTLY